MTAPALALNSTAMFFVLAFAVVTLYATGMVFTRRRLKKFRAPKNPDKHGSVQDIRRSD